MRGLPYWSRESGWVRGGMYIAAALVAGSASAKAQVRLFDLPAQEAFRSIPEFARQAGIEIFTPTERLRGVTLPSIRGEYDVRDALRTLLAGSPLEVASDDGNVIILRGIAAPPRERAGASAGEKRNARADNRAAYTPVVASIDQDEIVITGTRLTSGFETATPVTVLSSESLQAAAPNNIADALLQLPGLGGSLTGNTNSNGASSGNNGQNLMNLRNLGVARNLVLLNGRRVIATNTQNAVDINVMPQNLISRIDVVTGGASAAYGSDAVAGVLNFILDTKFTGLKGEIGAGVSSRWDLPNWKASAAYGGAFVHDRLHLIVSASYFNQNGTRVGDFMDRPWWDVQKGLIPNTTGSGPQNLIVPNLKASNGSDGGLITNTVLRGTNFLAGGTPAPFNYGYSPGTTFTSGGDGHSFSINFASTQWRTAEFAHAEYDLADDAALYTELSYAKAITDDPSQLPIETGARFQYTIFAGNPFIPAAVRSVMAANTIPSFTLGRYLREYDPMHIISRINMMREAVGVKGRDLFGGWNYDVSYSHGTSRQLLIQNNMPISHNMSAAADAVINPQTGQIVCRSQFYDTAGAFVPGGTGLDPGCKPINLFGPGSVTKEAQGWTVGDAFKDLHLQQDVVDAYISGNLGEAFSPAAGPVSVATGIEYRSERGVQNVNAFSTTLTDFTGIRGGPAALAGQLGPYRFFNPQPFSGAYNVKEGFFELGVPLLRDRPMVELLSTDMAVRYTDYSTSGGVTTWKIGAAYQMAPDIRFRGTVSRDIRAPNLLELFNTTTQGSTNLTYPSSAQGITLPAVTFSMGNPKLAPEKALTQTYGVVLTPAFLDGFQLSADYYDIKIKGAIDIVSDQQTIDNCFNNVPGFCDRVIVNAGALKILRPYLNLVVLESAGVDVEARYRTALAGSPLQLSLLATHLTKSHSQTAGGPLLSTLGDTIDPHWRANLQLSYKPGNWSVFVQERYIGPNLMDATKVEGVYTNENDVPAAAYTDVTVTYTLPAFGASSQIYLTVNNLLDKMPPISLAPPTSLNRPTNRNVYDPFGRYFNMGVRFKY